MNTYRLLKSSLLLTRKMKLLVLLFIYASRLVANVFKCQVSAGDTALIDHVMESFPIEDIDACYQRCATKPGCLSINFYRSNSFCELNNGTVGYSPSKKVQNRDAVYFMNPNPDYSFDSNILKNRKDYYDMMHSWLLPVTNKPRRWVPCYQSRYHGWSASTFHSRCDSKGPTITIIKVNKYIFGGYTGVDWHSRGSYNRSNRSFIFSYVNRDNLKPFKAKVNKYPQYAIYGGSSYGPTFGYGFDIYISDNAGSNTNSHTNFGYSYGPIKGYSPGSKKAQNLLAGTYSFQPDEIEVFRQEGGKI